MRAAGQGSGVQNRGIQTGVQNRTSRTRPASRTTEIAAARSAATRYDPAELGVDHGVIRVGVGSKGAVTATSESDQSTTYPLRVP